MMLAIGVCKIRVGYRLGIIELDLGSRVKGCYLDCGCDMRKKLGFCPTKMCVGTGVKNKMLL